MLQSCIQVIQKVTTQHASLNSVLAETLSRHKNQNEHAKIQMLCYGTLRWYHRLNAIAKQLIKTPLKDKDQAIYSLILIALYQLLEANIADYAAVNEAVNTAKKLKNPWAANLVNAVLRNFLRNKNEIFSNIPQSDVTLYSHPRWLIKALKHAWPDHWQQILIANNEHPPMFLRVNQLKTTRDDYLKKLEQAEIVAQPVADVANAILLTHPQPVNKLPAFDDGEVSVQDPAAQLAAELLALEPGQNILDACAAPGGKTCHILELEPKLKILVAVEKDAERIKKIEENLNRIIPTHKGIQIICGNAAEPTTWFNGEKFDRILIDAPCSATGIIRRHPDIKLLRQSTDIPQYPELQLNILNALWPLLNENGILIYATCSVLPQENVEVIREFITQHTNAKHIPINAPWGIAQDYGRQIFPTTNGMDGFYYAKLIKLD